MENMVPLIAPTAALVKISSIFMNFFTEPNFAHSSVKDRILRELPWICKRTMHVHPGLLAYMIRDGIDTASANEIQTFYESNGFCSLNHSKLLYAYTE